MIPFGISVGTVDRSLVHWLFIAGCWGNELTVDIRKLTEFFNFVLLITKGEVSDMQNVNEDKYILNNYKNLYKFASNYFNSLFSI